MEFSARLGKEVGHQEGHHVRFWIRPGVSKELGLLPADVKITATVSKPIDLTSYSLTRNNL